MLAWATELISAGHGDYFQVGSQTQVCSTCRSFLRAYLWQEDLWSLKDVHILLPKTYEYVMLYDTGELRCRRIWSCWSVTQQWGDSPQLSCVIWEGPLSSQDLEKWKMEAGETENQESQRAARGALGPTLLALRIEKEATSRGLGTLQKQQRAWKQILSRASRRNAALPTPWF